MSPYTLESVDCLSPAAMAGLRQIYEDGFPPHQRDDFDAVTSRRRDDELALALVGDWQPAGFAMLRTLGDTGWIYLRYFVVDRGRRDQGLGGLLWELLTARLREEGFTLLVFDVDDPEEPACGPDQSEVRFRRIRFYQRHGASLLPVSGYRAPDAAPETSGWSPMLLMTAPLSGNEDAFDGDWARAVAAAVYRFRWELAPGDFPALGLLTDGRDPRRHDGLHGKET
jgi:GNAT superfamily N-acetyltransferase